MEVRYEGRLVQLAAGETVLEGLERVGIAAPSSCRAGVCQACIMRVVDGPIPPRSQDGLKEAHKQAGYFLACISRPEQALSCEPAHVTAFRGWAEIQEVRRIGLGICRVRFERPALLSFKPGQFATFRREDGPGRSYSFASGVDQTDHFDIHVRLIPRGGMSQWMHADARSGDKLWIEGPKGDCMYYPGQSDEVLSLAGIGTGMAPLHAIAEDALLQGHKGPMTIYHGAPSEDRLYLVDELMALEKRHSNLRYIRCLMQGQAAPGVVIGDLKQLVLSEGSDPAKRRVYLCGDPAFVRDVKRKLFLRGVSLGKIHADPFIGTE